VELISITGERVMKLFGLNNIHVRINVGSLPAGLYLVKTYAGENIYINKLII